MKKTEKTNQAQVLSWCLSQGWVVDNFDSKGQFSSTVGRYTKNRGLPTGFPDISGCDKHGNHVLVEMKRKETEDVVRWSQYLYLRRFIHVAFVAVVSSPEQLEEVHKEWINYGSQADMIARLPKKALLETREGGKKVKKIIPIEWV